MATIQLTFEWRTTQALATHSRRLHESVLVMQLIDALLATRE
jgi:hypothetical protein